MADVRVLTAAKGLWLALCLGLMAIALVACAPWQGGVAPAGTGEVPAIIGQVVFPERVVQATLSDVASASTVSLIDATTNTTMGTTVTDGQGRFALSFGKSFKPTSGKTYYLEAVKGLSSNLAGNDAARVRTLVTPQADGWHSITSDLGSTNININEATTALAIIASLKGPATVPPGSLMGCLVVPGNTYTPVPNVSASEFTTVLGMASALLVGNTDPIAGVVYTAGTFVQAGGGGWVSATQTTARLGDLVTFQGIRFDATQSSNVVVFTPGATATVTGLTADLRSLTVMVPSGAMTGPVTIQAEGHVYGIPTFTIWGSLNVGVF